MTASREASASNIPAGAISIASPEDAGSAQSRSLLGTRVDATSYRHAVSCVARWIAARHPAYVCVTSVHGIMEAHDDQTFRDVLNGADLVTPDGMPLVWGLRLLGVSAASRVYGPDLTEAVCDWAAMAGTPVGFYGSTDAVLDRLIANLQSRHHGLSVCYRRSPPFRPLTPEEKRRELEEMRASGLRLLFVGLGCPKQERWMAERRDELDVVMLGVGAAFDYLAGTIRRPPPPIQKLGLEWAFRLACEPRRLWRRYLKNNPRFLVLLAREIISVKMNGEGI
jgi:N-acetylglucosaminyldiphosphoundecaprenol N-acetyl-beta-D-mannosaminyltransferase